jgi:hypothetical protein
MFSLSLLTATCSAVLALLSMKTIAGQNICEFSHLFRFMYAQLSLSPHISCGNLQRCSKRVIYCLIKQRAGNLSVLVELLCRTHCQCCHHVVCSRNNWHRGVTSSLYLPSLHTHTHTHTHTHIYIYIYIYILINIIKAVKYLKEVIKVTSINRVSLLVIKLWVTKKQIIMTACLFISR